MPRWHEYNPSNKPETCRWCGRVLRRHRQHDPNFRVDIHNLGARAKMPFYSKGGDYHDGFFCGLRCGYMYGVRMAEIVARHQAIQEAHQRNEP
jgi:hypothetical protein